MAAEKALYAKEDRRRIPAGEHVDIPFLLLTMLLLLCRVLRTMLLLSFRWLRLKVQTSLPFVGKPTN